MRGFGTKTRIVLAGVIGLILCGYAWWFPAPRKSPVALEIEIQKLGFNYEPMDNDPTPQFIDSTSDWLVQGRHMHSIAWRAQDLSDPPADPRYTGKYVHFALPEGADRRAMQRALAALASEGICQAVVDGAGRKPVPLIRIVRFTDASGRSHPCRERVAGKR